MGWKVWRESCAPNDTIAMFVAVAVAAAVAPQAHGDTLIDAAAEYAAFQQDVTALRDAPIDSTEALQAALERAARHDAEGLSRGWIAYGALNAAQSRRFQRDLRALERRHGRDAVLAGLSSDPSAYMGRRRGYTEALTRIAAAAQADSQRALAVGQRFDALGYQLQSQTWANGVIRNPGREAQRLRRLARLEPSNEARAVMASYAQTPVDAGAVWGDAAARNAGRASTRSPAVRNMAELAALRLLNADDGRWRSRSMQLLNEPVTQGCMEMAVLQYRQCLSVSHFRYETAACTGAHPLRDVGRCIAAGAN